MAEIYFEQSSAERLKGKVIVLTGGAQGIGAATVELLYNLGAHVFFGDWDDNKGAGVEKRLRGTEPRGPGSVTFSKVDVRDYQSQLSLFDMAYKQHGRVDAGIACAGVVEPGGWFEPENLNLESVRREPIPINTNIEINLTSVIAFARIALAFMKGDGQGPTNSPAGFSKSLVLVSSIAGITEAPGLFAYSSAKHGVIGLMRALRPWAPVKYAVRANAICPWATDTQLFTVKERWEEEKMPINKPEDVARMIVQCAADSTLNGKAVFVAGGRGFDTEEGIERLEPQWMGPELAATWRRGQEILGLGDKWTAK